MNGWRAHLSFGSRRVNIMNPAGYKYLGPGNPLDNGEPINHLDELAREHDISYDKAQDQVDILESDLEYTCKFMLNSLRPDVSATEKIWSVIGTVGLGLKSIESVPFLLTGTKNPLSYPSNLPQVKTQDQYQSIVNKISPTTGRIATLGTRILKQLDKNDNLNQSELDAIYTAMFAIGQIIDL